MFIWPIEGGKELYPIGPWENGVNEGTSEAHIARGGQPAIDIPVGYGHSIIAIHDAEVTYDNLMGDAGLVVQYEFITEEGHWLVRNCHCNAILVNFGDFVNLGETIAETGSTGVSTGPHLHFVIELNGNRVYPENYL